MLEVAFFKDWEKGFDGSLEYKRVGVCGRCYNNYKNRLKEERLNLYVKQEKKELEKNKK